MRAKEPFVVQNMINRKEWEDLFWLIAENDVVKYKELKGLEIATFLNFVERWKEAIRNKIKKNKQ